MLTFCRSQQRRVPLPAAQLDGKSKVSWQRGASSSCLPVGQRGAGRGVFFSSLLALIFFFAVPRMTSTKQGTLPP